MTINLRLHEPGATTTIGPIKGDWETYRTGLTGVDSSLANLITPAQVSSDMAGSAEEIDCTDISRLHIRALFEDASDSAGITVILWGNNAQPGFAKVVTTLTGDATLHNGASTNMYVSDVATVDVGPFTQAHIAVTTDGITTSCTLEVAGD